MAAECSRVGVCVVCVVCVICVVCAADELGRLRAACAGVGVEGGAAIRLCSARAERRREPCAREVGGRRARRHAGAGGVCVGVCEEGCQRKGEHGVGVLNTGSCMSVFLFCLCLFLVLSHAIDSFDLLAEAKQTQAVLFSTVHTDVTDKSQIDSVIRE